MTNTTQQYNNSTITFSKRYNDANRRKGTYTDGKSDGCDIIRDGEIIGYLSENERDHTPFMCYAKCGVLSLLTDGLYWYDLEKAKRHIVDLMTPSPKIKFHPAAENESQTFEIDGVVVGQICFFAGDRDNTEDHPLYIDDDQIKNPLVASLLELNGKFSDSRKTTQAAIVKLLNKNRQIAFADGVERNAIDAPARGIYVKGLHVGWIVKKKPNSDHQKYFCDSLYKVVLMNAETAARILDADRIRDIFVESCYLTMTAAAAAVVAAFVKNEQVKNA